jgi:hypothetical protein
MNEVDIARYQIAKGGFGLVLRIVSQQSLGFRHRHFISKDPRRRQTAQKYDEGSGKQLQNAIFTTKSRNSPKARGEIPRLCGHVATADAQTLLRVRRPLWLGANLEKMSTVERPAA